MINYWLIAATLWLPVAQAAPETDGAVDASDLDRIIQAGTPHITITEDIVTTQRIVIRSEEVVSLRVRTS